MSKLILAAAAAILISTPALAAEVQSDAPTQAVSTQGVNFASRTQVQHFYAKLRGAAQAVCDSGSANPRFSATDASCVRDVMAQAVRSADKPVLTAVYNANEQGVSSTRAFAGNDQ
jgi:UrcA family protein